MAVTIWYSNTNGGGAVPSHTHDASEIASGVLDIDRGGTNASTLEEAKSNLEIIAYEEVAGTPSIEPLEITYGGTGATTPKEALFNLGASGVKKLWTNPDSSSSFGAQTISLDLNDYEFVIIYFEAPIIIQIFLVGASADNLAAPVLSSIRFRNIQATKTGIIFGEGQYKTSFTDDTSTTDNTLLIPKIIYGVKGVA